ncbi:MAG: flagellar protein FlaG [Myxococcales bacterium]|nr:flagellar protein FlaG [Myxococcales bacterium]
MAIELVSSQNRASPDTSTPPPPRRADAPADERSSPTAQRVPTDASRTRDDALSTANVEAAEPEELRKVVESLNESVSALNTNLRFEVDERTEEVVVQIVDRETSKVIRQIPPKQLLELRARLKELAGGLLDTSG